MRDPLAEPDTTPVSMARPARDLAADAATGVPAAPDTPAVSNGRTERLSGPSCRVITVHHRLGSGDAEDPLFVAIADAAADAGADAGAVPCRDCDTEPPTLRDLVKAARAVGLVPRRRRHSATWTDWYAATATVIVEVVNDTGWDITLRATGIDVNLEGSAVTPARIAEAARLCGVPLFDLGAAT